MEVSRRAGCTWPPEVPYTSLISIPFLTKRSVASSTKRFFLVFRNRKVQGALDGFSLLSRVTLFVRA